MKIPTVSQPTPEQIAAAAYLIWEKEGQPHGRQEIHWLQAEKQLKADAAHEAGVLLRQNPTTPATAPKPQAAQRNKSKRQEAAV